MTELKTDILIVGGGTGGVAAALGATSLGFRVILTEETDWLGGQLTSQAVPPDENRWIEQGFGCTRRYRAFREGVRKFYRDHYPLTDAARNDAALNPGGGKVSRLCHEPRVALAVIEAMLQWPRTRGLLTVLLRHKPVAADVAGDHVRAVTLRDLETGAQRTIFADYILDATDLGDLLPLAKIEYVTGAESRADTHEPHALDGPANPNDVQSFTCCFAMSFDPSPGADHTIDKPAQYEKWRDYVPALTPPWPGRLLSWTYTSPRTMEPTTRVLFDSEATKDRAALFSYRQIVTRRHFAQRDAPHEVSLVNWPQNDYWEGNLIDQPPDVAARHIADAKQLSLSFLYWLQTEAPRPDGGAPSTSLRAGGYPALALRPDIVATTDGLAKHPYIRESRRIRARFTITETHVGIEARQLAGKDAKIAEPFADSVGIGHYNIDLHPSTAGRNYIDIPTLPFQIPLGSLLPQRIENLLPACKNLGVTHITNGCYRLHPVEWNIGESAGLLASFCLTNKTTPHAVHADRELTRHFQDLLVAQGIELAWPQSVLKG